MSLIPASYSKLSLYERCPAQAKYKHIDYLTTPKSPQAQRGTDLHASVEGFLRRDKTTIPKVAVPLKALLLTVRDSEPLIEYKLAFDHDFNNVLAWDSKKAWFRMVLDSAYVVDDKAKIQEWKSGKVYDDHEDQRNLYAACAVPGLGVTEAEITTYYLDVKHKVTLRLDAKAATLVRWRFAERIEAMARDKHWSPRPGYYCAWCPFSRYKGGPCKVG